MMMMMMCYVFVIRDVSRPPIMLLVVNQATIR